MSKILGIDVSEHNGTLDWAKIKAAGIKFAIIRSGYGTGHVDNCFKKNMEGAIANGLHIGIYHFSYALNATGAKNEAAFVDSLIKEYKSKIDMPVFFDFEYDTIAYAQKQGISLGRDAFNNHTVAFCEYLKSKGYNVGVYYNLDYLNKYVDNSRIGKYVKWFAQYSSTPGTSDYYMWQYSSSYKINGHSCKFDINVLKDGESLSMTDKKYTIGWHKDQGGWWYADSTSTYVTNGWKNVDGKWYAFDSNGYMKADTWYVDSTGTYYLGSDGAMLTNKTVEIGADGKLLPVAKERSYYLLEDVPTAYRADLDLLISNGILNGRNGSGDSLVLDMSDESVRLAVIMSRGFKKAGIIG